MSVARGRFCRIPGTLPFFLPHFLLLDLFLDGGLHVTINF